VKAKTDFSATFGQPKRNQQGAESPYGTDKIEHFVVIRGFRASIERKMSAARILARPTDEQSINTDSRPTPTKP